MRHRLGIVWLFFGLALGVSGCGSELDGLDASARDAGDGSDAMPMDRADSGSDGGFDAGYADDGGQVHDAGRDGGSVGDGGFDAGSYPDDAGSVGDGGFDAGSYPDDAGSVGDGGFDAGSDVEDAGSDLADAGAVTDAGAGDAGAGDAGVADAGLPNGGCVSGASGTHVARFRWAGSGPNSRAYVVYEANTLPDRSRWRAGAYSRGGIGYQPVFGDTFLGDGGLELSGTVFMDVELSTAGLAHVAKATIAIEGRSFATSSSGSFSWMSFDGAGASPYGGVANSVPYEWYVADATAALPAGNDGVLLRIDAAGPSNALVVRRVEICFDAR